MGSLRLRPEGLKVPRNICVATCIFSWFVANLVSAEDALPVERCNATGCTIYPAYEVWNDRVPCQASLVVYPTTEEEILAEVAKGAQNNQKLKVGTKYGHSIPKLSCPGSDNGVIISTENYTSIVAIDTRAMTVIAQSGIQLRDLLDAIANKSLSLAYSPYWDGVTLGGLLSTGAHGSGLFGKGSAVHEYVIGMRMVVPATAAEGYAKVVALNQTDDDLNATVVSLGVLGVISTVTLQLQPAFKRNVTLEFVDTDVGLEDRVVEIANNVEFGDVIWYPSAGKVVYRIDQRAPLGTPGEGVNRFFGFQPRLQFELETARSTEDLAESENDQIIKCQFANTTISLQSSLGYGFQSNGQSYSGFPVIGSQHIIQSTGGCEKNATAGYYCPWDPRIKGLFFFESSIKIPLGSIKDFLQDVRAMQDAYGGRSSFCGFDLYIGLFFRFIKASSNAYLGAQEDVVAVDFTYYRARDANTPKIYEEVVEELEQILLYKYGGKPHWGKNRNFAFEGVVKNYAGITKFLTVKDKLDPQGLFSSEWSDALLGVAKPGAPGVTKVQPYCALEGLCVCSEDVHCAPERNHFCRQGMVYAGARVCRFQDQAPSPAITPSSPTISEALPRASPIMGVPLFLSLLAFAAVFV